MITRILGVILAALAAQFVIDGLERSLPGARPRPSATTFHILNGDLGQVDRLQPGRHLPFDQLHVEALGRLGHEDRRGRHVGADQQIIAAIFATMIRRACASSPRNAVHHVGDRPVVAVIGAGDRVMMGDGDQPRARGRRS